ncbi:MAG: UDP-galactopyranose mutase, partial [Duncaniella sp.]|nr:UDP-galactopyranose mutase [Duncaniella sp.]
YQGIQIGGYNRLIDSLLDGVEVKLDTDFFADREHWESVADKIVFTGRIDQFYNFCYGHLEYRSVRFETETLHEPNHQGNAVVNYTSADVPYTRVIEHKHFEKFGTEVYENPVTVISREYSAELSEVKEPFYHVNDDRNQLLIERYRRLAEWDKERVIFGGRLAEYKYYDMAPIIEQVLKLFEQMK